MTDFLSGIPLRDGDWRREGRWWIHPDGTRVPVIAGGTNVFALTQERFRFYNDGTENGSTALAAENTNLTLLNGSQVHLRIGFSETGTGSISGATTDDYQLQVSKNGGAYANVTTSSSNVKAVASANLTDAGTTTQRLSAGTGSFVAGEISEAGLVTDRQITANNFSELLYAIEIVGADVAAGDTLDFRVLLNGATTNMTYSVTPRLTVSKTIATPAGSGTLTGVAASLALVFGLTAGALGLTGQSVGVGFQGPTTGSVDVTGAAPTVSVGAGSGTTIAIPAGAVAVTGTLLDGVYFLGTDAGALTLTGRTPAFAFVQPMPAGAIAATGTTSALLIDVPRALGLGTVAVSGAAPSLAEINTGTAGALTLGGVAPTILVGQSVATPAGSLAVTGTTSPVALVAAGTVGALTLSGTSPAIFTGALLTSGLGSLTLTGQAPSDLAWVMTQAAGAVTVTGQAPTLYIGQFLSVPAGTVAISGTTPTAASVVSLSAGTLAVTGQTPAVLSSISLAPPSATLTLTAGSPFLAVGLQGDVASLALSGLAPTLTFSLGIEPAAGTLTMTGALPSPLVGAAQIDTATLTMTGLAPSVAVQAQSRIYVVMRPDDVAIACPKDDITIRLLAEEYEVIV